MNIGKLDRYITIEQPVYSVSDDSNAKTVSSWTTYEECWASRIHKQSQEVFEAGQMVAKETFEWKLRFYDAPGLKSDMRINYDSDYYYLVGIKELGRKEAFLLTTVNRDN